MRICPICNKNEVRGMNVACENCLEHLENLKKSCYSKLGMEI